MPIYEYECSKCGHTLEAIQKISESALTKCPACHKNSLRKRVSAAAFHLKGSGWYVTDFKDKTKGGEIKDKTADSPPAKEVGKGDLKSTSTTPEKSEPAKKSEPASTE